MTFDDFRQAALAQGYDEVLERVWAPDQTVPLHQHDPDLWVRVVQGQVWLTVDEQTHHLKAGDTFALAAAKPHAERYGPEGATFWVARRSPLA